MKGKDEPLQVLTVCGVGMGSSLILRMTAEEAFRDLGVRAKVEATDLSSAKGAKPDMILAQGMHAAEFQGAAPVVIAVTNFVDKEALKSQLEEPMREAGWLE